MVTPPFFVGGVSFKAMPFVQIHDRGPALRPAEFGLKLVEHYARELGPYSK